MYAADYESPVRMAAEAARAVSVAASEVVERDRNARVRTMTRLGNDVVLHLSALATIDLKTTAEIGTPPEENERNRELTESLFNDMRDAYDILRSLALGVLERRLRQYAPDVWRQYKPLRDEALRRARDTLAMMSFLLGREEHIELGYDFVPQFEPGTVRGPLVDYENLLEGMSDLQLD